MHPRIVSTPEGGCAQEACLRTIHTPKDLSRGSGRAQAHFSKILYAQC